MKSASANQLIEVDRTISIVTHYIGRSDAIGTLTHSPQKQIMQRMILFKANETRCCRVHHDVLSFITIL